MTALKFLSRFTGKLNMQSSKHLPRCVMLAAVAVLILGACSVTCFAQTNVLTYHNDNSRTGQNLTETILTPAIVKSSTFGKLFTVSVDGKVDAQPLYVSAVALPVAGVRNVVYAATEHDTVYAFDADTGAPYWHLSLLGSGETPSDNRGCGQVTPEIGITATPVIDLTAGPHGTIYLIAMSKDSAGNYYQRLHALDITTGGEEFGAPINIAASYPGSGDNSSGGRVIFDPKQYKSRPGLLLLNGTVYTGWGSHCDFRPYTGWLMGYNELTLKQTYVFNFAPNGNEAALWGAGGGIAADASGSIFVQVANGTFDTTLNGQGFPSLGDYGNAFVKLALSGGQLQATDYWTMDNTVTESNADEDLGSGGLTLLPDLTDSTGHIRHLGTGAGKDGNVYVFNRDNMGKFDAVNNGTLYQELPGGLGGGEYASPAWFNGTVYYGAVGDVIRAFQVSSGLFSTSPVSTTATSFPYPGATPAISAKGTSNAILWAVENSDPAVLHAYDATNLATELYNSNQAAAGRDQFGSGNKFITPTIANGKVFVGTTNSVAAFGLISPSTAFPAGTVPPNYYADPNAVELGVKIRSDVAGYITGVRFYKNSVDTSVHTGSLWSSTGQLLATGTFTGESASGWQQLNFAAPVEIAANTTYVASYHTSSGFYSSNYYFASQGVNNGTLHELQAGADGPDGVYDYGSGGVFPTHTWESSNYWVDVVFSQSTTTPSNVFSPGTTPPSYYSDPNPVELAVKIRSDIAGYITGVRFYKNSADTSVHTGSLWSDSGQLLATGTFGNESASGWQQLNFSTPVAITANTTYVASYHTSSGFYSSKYYFANQGANNGTLHALQDGVDGPDGVFYYGSGGVFPSQSWESSNYWVDVVFSQTASKTPPATNIFASGTTPPSYYSDPNAVELAVKFRSDVAGHLTGVRFYKNPADTSVHTGSLWSDSGQLLATGTFTNETASGWQQLNFSTPVAIAANTTYLASYHTSSGFYSSNYYFANQGANNGTLHALEAGVDGPDGVFYYSSGGVFPTQTWESSNYWVDIVFTTP